MAAGDFVIEKRKGVGMFQIPLVFFAPRRLFERVENVTGYGGTLLVLLTALTLVGYATIETGLIDRAVQQRSAKRQIELERQFEDVVKRSDLIKALEEDRKQCEFERLATRLGKLVATPLSALASVLLISASLYGAVALGGRKPEWHTLMTIAVFASFVDVLGSVIRLVLMVRHSTLEVDTSAALLARLIPADQVGPPGTLTAIESLLSGIDPFRIWFWLVVLVGVTATAQLSKWRARIFCFMLWMMSSIGYIGLAFAMSPGRGMPGSA